MIYESLSDILAHTHALGFTDAVKVYNNDGVTYVDTIADDKSVIMYGKLNNYIPEFSKVGLSRLSVLDGYLRFPLFASEEAEIELVMQEKGTNLTPVEIRFDSKKGHVSTYRLMSEEVVDDKIKMPSFKGANWDVVLENPSAESLNNLAYFSRILNGFDTTFYITVSNDNNLIFNLGSSASDKVNVPLGECEVNGEISESWRWTLPQVLSILRYTDEERYSIYFSNKGAAKIKVKSNAGAYEYLLPART